MPIYLWLHTSPTDMATYSQYKYAALRIAGASAQVSEADQDKSMPGECFAVPQFFSAKSLPLIRSQNIVGISFSRKKWFSQHLTEQLTPKEASYSARCNFTHTKRQLSVLE